MALWLRPLVRLSNAAASKSRVSRGRSDFSTISFHQLKHPESARTSARYLPRFLDPKIYWNFSNPGPKAKRLQEKKPWNPATFYIAIFLLIGSQAIQIIALKLNHDEYIRRANNKIGVLKEVINRLHSGEEVDVEGMLGVGNEKEEKSWEEVLNEIEEEDEVWQEKVRKKRLSQAPNSEDNTDVEPNPTERLETEQQKTPKARQAQSARDYGYS